MRVVAVLFMFIWHGLAQAWAQNTPFPALFDVTGVAAGDVLNLRQGPTSHHPVIGTLGPLQKGVEVIRVENGWGRVGYGETMGWASMRYLQAQPVDQSESLPRPIFCSGTEPFWSLNIDQEGGHYANASGANLLLYENWSAPAAGTREYAYGLSLTNEMLAVESIILRDHCTDGMSDREYGLQIHSFLRTEQEMTLQTGCCSLSR